MPMGSGQGDWQVELRKERKAASDPRSESIAAAEEPFLFLGGGPIATQTSERRWQQTAQGLESQ